MHVCRIQEGYIRHPRSITTLLGKYIQEPRINGLPEKRILLLCDEKIIKDKQFTILWHVENLDMLHLDSNIVSGILACIDL